MTPPTRIEAAGLDWCVSDMGTGPVCLLIHGTGSSHASWRDVAPLLSDKFRVVAPDLPGHAATQHPHGSDRLSMKSMAGKLGAMLKAMGLAPDVIVGHSAGTAIAVRMVLDSIATPVGIVSFNGALIPFAGAAGRIFSPMAKMLSAGSFAASMFARRAEDPAYVRQLLASTGSRLSPEGEAHYMTLARDPDHVRAALGMMANWDLSSLTRDLSGLTLPLALVVGSRDGTVPPSDASRVKRMVQAAEIIRYEGLGHLAHEEQPEKAANTISDCYGRWRG